MGMIQSGYEKAFDLGYKAGLEVASDIVKPVGEIPKHPYQSATEIVAYDTRRNMVIDIENEILNVSGEK